MKRLLASLALVLTLLAASPLPAAAWSPFGSGVCDRTGTDTSAVCSGQQTTDPLSGKNGVLVAVTHIVAIAAGIAAVILIIIGAIRYITSSGDSNGINSAKNTIIYALVGLIVIVIAQTLIAYVVSRI